MVEVGEHQGSLDHRGGEEPRAAAGFEPPSLTVIGTVQELTQGKPVGGQDGMFPNSFN